MKLFRSKFLIVAAALLTAAPLAAPVAAQAQANITIEAQRAPKLRYTVRPGDTLASIARDAGVPIQIIVLLNPGLDVGRLRAGDVIIVPRLTAPISRPTIALDPTRGSPDTEVTITGRGFEPNARLRLLVGRRAGELESIERVRADARGSIRIRTDLPEWARPGREVFFGLQAVDRRQPAVSAAFRVIAREPRPDRVTVTGTITRRGVECPVMRGDDGRTYSLAGDLDGFGPGDRVEVRGRIAEASICQQGTTIEVRRIEEID